jgi:hypothetical protein
VGGQRHAPAALPPGTSLYPLYRSLCGAPGLVWTGAANLAPTGDPRIVQSVASRYTDYAIPAHSTKVNLLIIWRTLRFSQKTLQCSICQFSVVFC